jgi:hypothetical protein
MAQVKWILFGLSLFSLVLGLTLVLVFINELVVPSVNKHIHVWKQCLVLNITRIAMPSSIKEDYWQHQQEQSITEGGNSLNHSASWQDGVPKGLNVGYGDLVEDGYMDKLHLFTVSKDTDVLSDQSHSHIGCFVVSVDNTAFGMGLFN